jgi:hypothetical protein
MRPPSYLSPGLSYRLPAKLCGMVMQNRAPRKPGQIPKLPDFTPVPRKCARHDGWTPERQRAFIEALATTGSVKHAAKAVNMSSEGAYHLRRQPGAEDFAAAWAEALDHGIQRLEDIALERAIHGVEVPVYSYGKLVGTRIVHNDRLLMFLLRNRAADRFAAGASAKRLNQTDVQALRREWEEERRLEYGSAADRVREEMRKVRERLFGGPDEEDDDEEDDGNAF